MYQKKPITPPHPKRYLQSCASLERTLSRVDHMPVAFVCGQCWRVITDSFGSQWKALSWIVFKVLEHYWRKTEDSVWYFWQKWIMRRDEEQIDKQVTKRVKKRLGVDLDQAGRIADEADARMKAERKE